MNDNTPNHHHDNEWSSIMIRGKGPIHLSVYSLVGTFIGPNIHLYEFLISKANEIHELDI
jgi:hypothetical protein